MNQYRDEAEMQTQMLIDEVIEALQSQIDDTAIIACSGGIDSDLCCRPAGALKRLLSSLLNRRSRFSFYLLESGWGAPPWVQNSFWSS